MLLKVLEYGWDVVRLEFGGDLDHEADTRIF